MAVNATPRAWIRMMKKPETKSGGLDLEQEGNSWYGVGADNFPVESAHEKRWHLEESPCVYRQVQSQMAEVVSHRSRRPSF